MLFISLVAIFIYIFSKSDFWGCVGVLIPLLQVAASFIPQLPGEIALALSLIISMFFAKQLMEAVNCERIRKRTIGCWMLLMLLSVFIR